VTLGSRRASNAHRDELDAAREGLVSEAVKKLRAGLVAAARRLRREAEDASASVDVRAALGLFSAHHDMATLGDIQARVAALEARG
jgi:hypothetical protein